MINWNDNRVWAWLILGILFVTVIITIILSNCEKIENNKPPNPQPMTDEEKTELQQKDQDQREAVIYPQNDKGGE